MAAGKFSLEDFRTQMQWIRRLGSLKDIMKMIPGLGGMMDQLPEMADPEKDMGRIEAIISSMTKEERLNPDRIDRSRRHRIARGSGTDPADVSRILKDFSAMSGMMQKMSGLGMMDRMKAMSQLGQAGMFNPGANLKQQKERSKRGPADQKLADEKRKKARKEAKKQKKRNR